MNSEIKQKWIEALRSGKYKQGTQYLKTEDGKYCCLGVLCELMGMESDLVSAPSNKKPDGKVCEYFFGEGLNSRNRYVLPEKFQLEINLSEEHETYLIQLNDEDDATFEEIADYIEKNL